MLGAVREPNRTTTAPDSTAASDTAALHARVRRADTLNLHQSLIISFLTELLSCSSLESALDALADALKARFKCDRVAVALCIDNDLVLSTVSQQAVLMPSSSEAQLLVDAMHEACVQESVLIWPSASTTLGELIAHRALSGRRSTGTICSVPMFVDQELIGALLLERRDQRRFPVATLERISAGIAPLIRLHLRADRNWWSVLQHSIKSRIARHLGNERPGVRALAVVVTIGFLACLTLTTRLEIVAPAELISQQRHLVTASQTGFLSDVQISAGDQVKAGQLIARLDRREMELEASSRESEIVMADAEFRAAMASGDRQAISMAHARLAQVRARSEALDQQLLRTDLVSPIDGIVIAADVTRTAGSPVTRGETLFEIAPDAGYEVHVLVDETDVYDVFTGQTGSLALRARPGEALPVVVESVHPVAEPKEGTNRFRVRANLTDSELPLRPGQSGVVRLDAGRMRLLAAWFRPVNRHIAEWWWRLVG